MIHSCFAHEPGMHCNIFELRSADLIGPAVFCVGFSGYTAPQKNSEDDGMMFLFVSTLEATEDILVNVDGDNLIGAGLDTDCCDGKLG